MSTFDTNAYSELELEAEFNRLFPQGFAGADILEELAPTGWEHSPLEWLNYSPSEALAKDQEQQERDRELAELRESLDEGYREAIEEALKGPPPTTVRAYEAVYGHRPRGWPPST